MSNQAKLQRSLELLMSLNCKYGISVNEIADRFQISERTVYRYIETIRNAGFVVDKKQSDGKLFYRINKEESQHRDISELLHFSKEEAYLLSRSIHSINEENELKINLIRKLYSLYDSERVSVPIIKKENSANIHTLADAIHEKKQVILKNYNSSHSGRTYDRVVEPFSFTTNFVAVWCFDSENQANKIYKTSRIEEVEATDQPWQYERLHEEAFMDAFRISGYTKIPVKLSLSMLAKNLLVEEYPLAEPDITRTHDNEYIFESEVAGMDGVGRFVLGLIDEVTIHYPESLKQHIKEKFHAKNF